MSMSARGVAIAFAALVCTAAVGGCTPLPTLTPVSSAVAFEGGSCDLVLNATNLTGGTQYGVGMFTTGTPVQLGELTAGSSGSINGGRVDVSEPDLSQGLPERERRAVHPAGRPAGRGHRLGQADHPGVLGDGPGTVRAGCSRPIQVGLPADKPVAPVCSNGWDAAAGLLPHDQI